jgi:hypothetical protein
MNRKYEDQLIELAFGDMTPEEARRLEEQALADPEAARALQTYRDVRDGLRAMAVVPEHQLSNERLRDAILARGLDNKKKESSRTWWWMPVGAMAMAFALVFMRNNTATNDPQVMVVQSTPKTTVAKNESAAATNPVAAAIQTKSVSTEPEPKPAEPLTVVSPEPEVRTVVRYVERPVYRVREVVREVPKPTRPKAEVSVDKGASAVVAMTKPTDLPPVLPDELADKTAQPIVLIASEQDAQTGAQVATEVDNASNVLVGG